MSIVYDNTFQQLFHAHSTPKKPVEVGPPNFLDRIARKKCVFFLGGGNMAAAIIGGLDRDHWRVVVCEVLPGRRKELEETLRVETVDNVADRKISVRFRENSSHPPTKLSDAYLSPFTVQEAHAVVFAIKPQQTVEVLQSLKNTDLSGKTIISIMAGVPLSVLKRGINGHSVRFVRTMPNTPLLVGKGVTGVYVEDNTAKEIVEDLLKATSQLFYCKEEDDLNKVCAISGSGPAYFFLFVEALRDAGIKMGLKPDDATQMAIGTCLGAGTLAANAFGKDDVSKLRENVTSKGGTTEAALNQFAAHKLRETTEAAALAALNRGRELARDVEMKSKL